jgi:histidine triad (HIT) family protein
MEELAPEGVNLLQSNGPGAAQSVPHLHIHVLPRRADDGLAMNWTPRPGECAAIEEVYQRLRRRLTGAAGTGAAPAR